MVEIAGWPPRWLTQVPIEDIERGDGDLYAEFAEAVCRVTKDSVASPAGKLLQLRPWQKELLRHTLARREDGRFRHRTALIGMSRKNGKSALAASMGLAGLTMGGNGSEIYSCAADRDQARIVFGTAKRMIELDEELSSMFTLYRDAIEFKDKGSVYRVLSAEAYSKEGLNPSPLVIFDEVHAQPSWELKAMAKILFATRFTNTAKRLLRVKLRILHFSFRGGSQLHLKVITGINHFGKRLTLGLQILWTKRKCKAPYCVHLKLNFVQSALTVS
jgi:phage terminase large subunit-like protein